jgi:hypothetical protein
VEEPQMAGVKVNLGALREAAAQYGQRLGRAPAGARGKVAPDTLLYRKDGNLIVSTPFLNTGIEIREGEWTGEVSVQPKAFSDILNDCAKQWKDVGGDAAEVTLSFEAGTLTIRWTDGKSARSRSMPAKRTA